MLLIKLLKISNLSFTASKLRIEYNHKAFFYELEKIKTDQLSMNCQGDVLKIKSPKGNVAGLINESVEC